jgi:hypothetical protein
VAAAAIPTATTGTVATAGPTPTIKYVFLVIIAPSSIDGIGICTIQRRLVVINSSVSSILCRQHHGFQDVDDIRNPRLSFGLASNCYLNISGTFTHLGPIQTATHEHLLNLLLSIISAPGWCCWEFFCCDESVTNGVRQIRATPIWAW